jgi:hypothetical protein
MRSYSLRRALALGAVALAMAFSLPRFLTHTPYPRLGVRLDWNTKSGNPRVTSVVGPPGQGLFQKDDVIVSVGDLPFTQPEISKYQQKTGRKGLPPGTVRDHDLARRRATRDDGAAAQAVAMAARAALRVPARHRDRGAARRHPARLAPHRSRRGMGVPAVRGARGDRHDLRAVPLPQGDLSPALKAYVSVYQAVVLWLPASFLHFMMMFPRPRWEGRRARTSLAFWLVVVAYLVPVVLLVLPHVTHLELDKLDMWFQAVVFPLGGISLIQRYWRGGRDGTAAPMRERMLAAIVAVVLCLAAIVDLLPDEPHVMAVFSLPLMQLFSTALYFAWLSTPFLIAYLLANDPAFDPRRLIAHSLPYAILSGLLAAVYLGIVLIGQRLFAEATGEETIVFNVIAALVVAFAFAPLRERLQAGLDRVFGRDPMALRLALERSGRELLSALDPAEVRRSVEAALQRGLRRKVAVAWDVSALPQLAEDIAPAERGAGRGAAAPGRHPARESPIARAAHGGRAQRRGAARIRDSRRAARAPRAGPAALPVQRAQRAVVPDRDGSARAQRFAERLADMLRYAVEAGDRSAALLSEEIAFVEDYLGVARERYDNELSFEYIGARELLSTSVPPLLLQPLVENSLKHGCAADGRPLRLALEAVGDGDWVSLRFTDDGAPNSRAERGLGVGLENLDQRVRRFGGAGASVTATRLQGGGFAVTMRWRAVPATSPARSVIP